jgi:hypothetical protein
VLLGVPFLFKQSVLACSCAELKEPNEALADSTAVFVGRVTEIEMNQYSHEAIFEIREAWKGIESDNPVAKITTGTSGDVCGYDFQEDKEYLVYAYGDTNHLATGICTRTMALDSAEYDLAALGPSTISFDQDDENTQYEFVIWTEQSEISESWKGWNSVVRTRVCPNPNFQLVGPSELSTLNVTHFATSSDGTASPVLTEYIPGSNDFCAGYVAFQPELGGPGEWIIRANASWAAPDGSIHRLQSNEARILVKPDIYVNTNSEVLFEYDANYFRELRLLDWNSNGQAILVSYDHRYENNSTGEIETADEYESIVSLGVLDPNETTINRVNLPVDFYYVIDARYSPSNYDIIFITGSMGDQELQSGLFVYSFERGSLTRIGSFGDDVAWIPDVTGDGQDDFVIGITNSTLGVSSSTENMFELWITDSQANPIEKLYSEVLDSKKGVQVHDVTNDGRKILMTLSESLGGPAVSYKLAVFDIESRKFDSIVPDGAPNARFSPTGDLIIYDIGSGYHSPGGPLIVTTLDGSYSERLYSGERAGSYDSPISYVISPDGTSIIAAVAEWGSGNIYVTKNELAHPMPEFTSPYVPLLAVSVLVAFYLIRGVVKPRRNTWRA